MAAPRGRAFDPRHEQPRRVQQPRSPAPARRGRDPRAGRAALFRHQRLGGGTARRTREPLARAGRICRRPGFLHARRCRCERARRQDRSTGHREAARRGHRARPFLSRRDVPGDGPLRRHPHPHAGRSRRARGQPRRAAVCLPLPVRQQRRRRVRRTGSARGRGSDRPLRRRSSRRRDHGAERRLERHRGPGQLLAGAAPPHRGTRDHADRRRGDERVRALRRVVRLAASRRGGSARHDDARQGPHRRSRAARRDRAVERDRCARRERDALHGPHVLWPSARLRGWRRSARRLR